jgi:hypothetical protein
MRRLDQIQKRLDDATPGPWDRPLNTRTKSTVTAPLPADEEGQFTDRLDIDGNPERVVVVGCQIWSNGRHDRRRSGRDLELIAHAPADLADLVAVVREVEALAVEWEQAADRRSDSTDDLFDPEAADSYRSRARDLRDALQRLTEDEDWD